MQEEIQLDSKHKHRPNEERQGYQMLKRDMHDETKETKENKETQWAMQENRKHAQTSDVCPSKMVTSELGISHARDVEAVEISIGSAPTNIIMITIVCL